jgi:DNA-binding NarL/FixJ family response regulator
MAVQKTHGALQNQETPESNRSPSSLRKIRVLVTDEHPLIRDVLIGLLEMEEDIEVVGQADNGRTAIELVRQLQSDVVLVDVSMPGLDGIEVTRQIIQEFPDIRIIGQATQADENMAERMHAAGAVAFFAKSGSIDELLAAIRGK